MLNPGKGREDLPSRLFRRICCGAVFFVAAAASFHGYYDKWHFREAGVPYATSNLTNGRFGLADIVDETATRPFVYRQLVPAMARWLDRVAPESAKACLHGLVANREQPTAIVTGSLLASDPNFEFRYFCVYFLTFLFTWLSVFAMYLVCRTLEFSPVTSILAPVLMILAIPYFMSVGGYFYDYPELAFLSLAVWMALRLDWWWLLPLTAAATWNKESFVLITLTLYPILRSRNSRPAALIGTGALFVTSALAYGALRLEFLHNAGSTVLPQWRSQLLFLFNPSNAFGLEATYGVIAFRSSSLVGLALMAWIVRRAWSKLPKAIQRHAKIAAAINIPLYLLFCVAGEMRDLSMLYVFFMLSIAANLAKIESDWRPIGEPLIAAAAERELPRWSTRGRHREQTDGRNEH